jgi:hypothetical protein
MISPRDSSSSFERYRPSRPETVERRRFRWQFVETRGVQLQVVDSVECYELMRRFISEQPKLWYEDIGKTKIG